MRRTAAVPIRSLALRFTQANGQQWRTGMNSMPVFPVGTPEAFYQLQQAQSPDPATGKPEPGRVPAFFAAHPEGTFPGVGQDRQALGQLRHGNLQQRQRVYLVNAAGQRQAVRWSIVPVAQDAPGATAPEGSDFLERPGATHGRRAVALAVEHHLANPGDPVNDASKTWPDGARC
jgi:catalase